MKIIIAGSGDTGIHLAKMLSNEKQDVVLMSTDRDCLDGLDASYNLMTCIGYPTVIGNLRDAEVDNADMFVAVTPSGSDNMVACQLASHLGCKETVARVENPEYISESVARAFASTGVSTLIYPESLVAEEIMNFIERNWVVRWHELHGGELIFAGVRIEPEGSVVGKKLSELQTTERTFHVLAIHRGRKMIIPRGHDTLEAGDVAYFTILPSRKDSLGTLTGHKSCKIRNIMISGGGNISRQLLGLMNGHYNVTLIDPDEKNCRDIAEEYSYAAVVNAAASDLSVMKSEEIGSMDLFVALEGSAASNIVSCMMAKEMGALHTVAQIEDTQYINEAERLGIDKIVNKKLITSATILKNILGADVHVNTLFSMEEAEVAEIEAHEGSRIVKDVVRSLNIPDGITLGGIVRGSHGMLVDGNTHIQPGDKVMVIFLPGALMKVMKLFRKELRFC